MKKSPVILLMLLWGITPNAYSQTSFGFGLQFGTPINAFRDNTKAVGAGVNANLYVPLGRDVPVFIGINAGYMLYGSSTKAINQNIAFYSNNSPINGGSIPVNIDVMTNNNMFNGNLALRVKIPIPIVKPYVEGLVGFNYLYTRTSIYDRTSNSIFTQNQNSRLINSRTQSKSTVLQYGLGAGVVIKLTESLGLDIRATYLAGGKAKYFDSSQTQNWRVISVSDPYTSGNAVTLNTDGAAQKDSTTDLFLINVGLTIDL